MRIRSSQENFKYIINIMYQNKYFKDRLFKVWIPDHSSNFYYKDSKNNYEITLKDHNFEKITAEKCNVNGIITVFMVILEDYDFNDQIPDPSLKSRFNFTKFPNSYNSKVIFEKKNKRKEQGISRLRLNEKTKIQMDMIVINSWEIFFDTYLAVNTINHLRDLYIDIENRQIRSAEEIKRVFNHELNNYNK